MESKEQMRSIIFIKLSGLYHIILGLAGLFLTSLLSTVLQYQIDGNLSAFLGIYYIIFGIGYMVSAFFIEENWLIILLGFVQKITFLLVAIVLGFKNGFNPALSIFFIIDSLIFIIPFYKSLDFIFRSRNSDDELGLKFSDVVKNVRTNTGENLLTLSYNKPILMVFIRHFGCTFCKETVSEISNVENQIREKGLTPVFVHLSDPSYGDKFFEKYFSHQVLHVSDPCRRLYRSLDIKRGNLWQLFGLPTWYRGFVAGVFKGHGGPGEIEGDFLQLGAYFVLDKGQIVFSHYNHSASEQFDLSTIKN